MAIIYNSGRRVQALESDYTRSVVHSVTSGTTDYSLTSGNRGHANEIHGTSPLIGQTIGSISFEFKGTDTGLIRGLIISGSTGGIVADCGTIDSSTVTSSYAWYEFTCSSYTLQNGDRIAFELLGSGTTLKARGTSSSTDAGLRWYIVPSGAYPKNINYQNTNEINVKVSDYKDPKPTNVQVGSRLEETDTRKMYHYEDGATVSDDFTDDQSTLNTRWVSDSSNVIADATNNNLKVNIVIESSNKECMIDLGTNVSETNWLIDFDFDIDSWTQYTTGSSASDTYILMSSINNASSSTGDHLGLKIRTYTDDIFLMFGNGSLISDGTASTAFVSDPSTLGIRYFRYIRKSPTDFTVELYSTSARTGTPTETFTATISSAYTGFRYFGVMAHNNLVSGDGLMNATISNFKFYNGVTTPSNAWKEEGT